MIAWVFPGQGSQRREMGAEVFDRFPELVAKADDILGYSIKELCLNDPGNQLKLTQYAQPALFIVNALTYLAHLENGGAPDFLAGHSLGEYNALFAAGCFDFETGVQLVQRRGELMARANGGGMAAILGLEVDRVRALIAQCGATDLTIANYNSPTQLVLSGSRDGINKIAEAIQREGKGRCIPLNVSAAFHSPYMEDAAAAFEDFLYSVTFADPKIPVISNVTARPYEPGSVRTLLGQQIRKPVRWWDSARYLIEQGVDELEEIGPGDVLTKLWNTGRQADPSLPPPRSQNGLVKHEQQTSQNLAAPARFGISPERLGSAEFRHDYGIRYAYLSGSMYKGIASADMVIRMGKAGLMGFFGAGGLKLDQIEDAIRLIQRELGPNASYGMNLLYPLDNPALEDATVALYLRYGVRFVEAAGYTQITAPLAHFRFKGAQRNSAGRPVAAQHVLAKVSRPEVASAFMRPPSDAILRQLVEAGKLTAYEAEIARQLPISDDICVESDSGGHTDGGIALTLMPAMLRLRDEMMARYGYTKQIRVGAAGGIGAPESAAAAFILGADFIITGSVNQCTPQAGTSAAVKEILADLDVQDTTYAPAGDMFEMGARVQVVRKGTLFPARANKLYQVYRQYGALEELDQQTRRTIEESYFKRSFAEVWQETRDYLAKNKPLEIEKAERNPKHKMALVFKWYFIHSTRMAMRGVPDEKVNYQIHCGPAMGAFNRFVKGTDLEDWRNRHVDLIAERLMQGAAAELERRFQRFT